MVTTQILKNVGTKLPRVGAYISPQLKADLEKLAKKEQRTLSNFIAVALQRVIDEARQKGEIN
jgi:mRNA-degrading endonuclease RelE of RelBE toxin-antitoxin system